mmetsp:Transcript_15583/g.18524  ORF Transcript_15583/g.18524 Transcript_15583/m.18524 type:complete len:119 (+) Transcript_15583:1303-1659(+)|eukprot:CAMPEP_0185606784 /NCGR_PEP_ID=MMETSP0436-20130131/5026_1 /TAXON_ID=626734 ORGANISM="Favella taraikaensis, Strain Fe Narragansett Bay" /NCGR_SAMPLE_ID=MMETSP0436 /ASSEMBLY_ACC=CAM_ASM_000390 /LENGTH=118 /DNA_ID=CAMNT_0028238471 /DNA_START=1187 /DNA_END=1543 /DNA_ORIENTATION=-
MPPKIGVSGAKAQIGSAGKPKGLTIEICDERRCNLEDDESFEDAASKPLPSRQAMTPAASASRKNSINITPKSRVIEPGKIFNSRQMTPASAAAGMRGRMSGLHVGTSNPLRSSGSGL